VNANRVGAMVSQKTNSNKMKTMTFASVLTFIALVCMVEEAEANAYLYCELKGWFLQKGLGL
jgi:hypothetical protein